MQPAPRSTLFPYTTLFRSQVGYSLEQLLESGKHLDERSEQRDAETQDRKSTRLNSSHLGISYAVFCLKRCSQHRDLHSFPTRRSSDLKWGTVWSSCWSRGSIWTSARSNVTPKR